MSKTTQAGKLGHYTWIIDEIMIEEAETKTEASSYVKPFDTDKNPKGLQSNVFSAEFADEFIQLVAYCTGTSFVPPKLEIIRGEMNVNSKKIIKRLRNRLLHMYNYANDTNTSDYLPKIPVSPDFGDDSSM